MMLSYYGIDGEGQWNDIPCDAEDRFACKMEFSE